MNFNSCYKAYGFSANAIGIFCPVLTIVLYVLLARLNGESIDTRTVFTTTALLSLITHPANMIMTIIPQAVGALAAFGRIQSFLLEPPRSDVRRVPKKDNDLFSNKAIQWNGVTLTSTMGGAILTKIDLCVDLGTTVFCTGTVGSGKTMLLRSLLGESVPTEGTITVLTRRLAFCAQSPWLPNCTLKEAVLGFCTEEPSWYEQVIESCCLKEDLSSLSRGDCTVIGSRGMNLSGGQKQRVVGIPLSVIHYLHRWIYGLRSACPCLHFGMQYLEITATDRYVGCCSCNLRSVRHCSFGRLFQCSGCRDRREDDA